MRPRALIACALFALSGGLSCGPSNDTASPCASAGSSYGVSTVAVGGPYAGYGGPAYGGIYGWYGVDDGWSGPIDDGAYGDTTSEGTSSGDDTRSGDGTSSSDGTSSGEDTGGGDTGGGDDGSGESARIHVTSGGFASGACVACALSCTTIAGANGTATTYQTTAVSASGYDSACSAAQDALVKWAHRHAGARVAACRRVDDTSSSSAPYQRAAPTVGAAPTTTPSRSARLPQASRAPLPPAPASGPR